ncbi:MAG: glycosyltransferase [Thermoanaerobaculales bacterium]|nr:glycosyltransferase [Thermoanaerobaculales bacterium]
MSPSGLAVDTDGGMPGRRLRILLLSHLGSRRAPTGAENVLVHLARGLKARGHEVAVAAPGQWVLEPELERAGVGLRRVAVRSCWLVQSAPQPLPLQAWRLLRYLAPDRGSAVLRRVMRELAPDVVLVNCLPHLRGAAAARACGLPVVWHLHEILPPGLRRRCFARRLRRDATRIVAVSEAVASWLREEGLGGRVEVVLNGVAPPAAMPERGAARVQFGLPPEACVVGLFSQLVPHKGALDFVRAAHLAAERRCSSARSRPGRRLSASGWCRRSPRSGRCSRRSTSRRSPPCGRTRCRGW